MQVERVRSGNLSSVSFREALWSLVAALASVAKKFGMGAWDAVFRG